MKKAVPMVVVLFIALIFAACEKPVESYEKGAGKARMVEAQINLPAIVAMQAGFRAMSQRYAASFKELGYALSGENQNYSYFLGNDMIKGARGPDKLPEGLSIPAPTAESFVIYAIANLDDDPDLDIWKIDQSGNLQHVRLDL